MFSQAIMQDFNFLLETIGEFGIVVQVRYPIVIVSGLPHVRLHELVVFETGEKGEVFLVERSQVQILILSKEAIKPGTRVARTNQFFMVPVGDALLGEIIDPLGDPISEKGKKIKTSEKREIDISPLGIGAREKIKNPFQTGVMVVDTMIPLGKGQKELIIGDRKTGKTSFLLTTIKNQVKQDTIAIYAAIAKKKSDIKKIHEFFIKEGIADKTVILATTSYDSPSLIFLTPYSAMTVAEYFRDQGKDVLLILDDLSTHAKFYREVSLLAKRFPGRDSYPGDIFYVHSRLLERTGNFKHKTKGEVSITALPVVEIVEGDFTGYIATNLMGMTDGHIYFDSNVYYQGRRPAVNVSLSVTRVGKQVSSNVFKSINRELSTLFALYEKMQNLSHFGAELTDSVRHVLRTGETFYKFFDQPYTLTVPQEVQLAVIAMIWLRFFEDNAIETITKTRDALVQAYEDKKHEKLFSEMAVCNDFNALLAYVSSHKDELLKISAAAMVNGKSSVANGGANGQQTNNTTRN